MSEFVPLALATLVDRAPTGPGWIHEVKYDGYRIEAVVHDGNCTLYSRNGLDWTSRLPGIAAGCESLGEELVVDGEVIASGSKSGDFQALQQRLDQPLTRGVRYVLFDLMAVSGRSVRKAPLDERRAGLKELLVGRRGPLRLSRELTWNDDELLQRACSSGLEGIISKRRSAPYRSGRTMEWRKTKCDMRQELAIVGFTPPSGSRHGFGSLLLAYREGNSWQYAGRVGSGFDTAALESLTSRMERLERTTSPLAELPSDLPRGTRWVRPQLVAEVRFTQWTRDGRLRHPVFLGLRTDKPASSIRRERPRSAS